MSLQDRVGIGLRRFRSADERTKSKSDIFILLVITGEQEKEGAGEIFSRGLGNEVVASTWVKAQWPFYRRAGLA